MLVRVYASTYLHNHRVGTEQQPLLTGLAVAGSTALGRVLACRIGYCLHRWWHKTS
jgi:hypothetical protein